MKRKYKIKKDSSNKDKPIRVAWYIRCSTDEQFKHGYSVEMQKDALEKETKHRAENNNWITKEDWIFIDEGQSGADLKRSEFERMMNYVKDGEFDLVLVWKIDRLSRNLTHLLSTFEKMKKYKVSFCSIKENIDFSGAIGTLIFQIFGALAQFERELIRARSMEGVRTSAKAGNWTSTGVPYGYERVKNASGKGTTLKIIPEEAKWILQMYEWFVYEGKNYEDIARLMNEKKVPKGKSSPAKTKDTKWHAYSISTMLANTVYMGEKVKQYQDSDDPDEIEEVLVKVPAIVNKTLFRQAQHLIEEIKETRGKKGGGNNFYLLSRKIVDKLTGRHFVGVPRTKGGFSYRRQAIYDINGEMIHKNLEMPASEIDGFVWGEIERFINDPKKFYEIYERNKYHKKELDRLLKKQEECKQIIFLNESKITQLYDDYYEGKHSEKDKDKLEKKFRDAISINEKEIKTIEGRIRALTALEIASDTLQRFSDKFRKDLSKMNVIQKNQIVSLLVERIEVAENSGEIDVNIVFRFAPQVENIKIDKNEPKNSSTNKRKPPNGGLSNDTNTPGETRTHDTLLKRQVL